MKPPTHVRIGPYRYRVELADLGDMADPEDEREDNGFGEYAPEVETIRLNKNQRPDSLADTLLHEVLHAVLGYTGAQEMLKTFNDSAEEFVVSALTGELLNVLRRNPSLVSFLTSKG